MSGSAASRREGAIFALSVGIVGCHIADDSFLQPQPGTSAGDHLFSGLIPLAVLALAAWAYPRLRAGARAPIALALGLLGMVTGAEAIHYSREVGISGDDYTGLLAIPAGLSLVGLGAVTLWRTRRTDNGLRRRYLRRLSWTALALVATFLVLFPLSLAYVITHAARATAPPAGLGAACERRPRSRVDRRGCSDFSNRWSLARRRRTSTRATRVSSAFSRPAQSPEHRNR